MVVSVLYQILLCAVPDVEHMRGVALDGEEDTVRVVARTVEELW